MLWSYVFSFFLAEKTSLVVSFSLVLNTTKSFLYFAFTGLKMSDRGFSSLVLSFKVKRYFLHVVLFWGHPGIKEGMLIITSSNPLNEMNAWYNKELNLPWRCVSLKKTAVFQVFFDDNVCDGIKHKLNVLCVSGTGHVRVDFLDVSTHV